MKDLTHYFQTPKPASNGFETTAAKTTSKCKRKASESVDPERTKSLTVCDGDTTEEEVFTTKKLRRSNSSSKKKTSKPSRSDTPLTDSISDDENTPILKRIEKCNVDVTDNSTPVNKVRTYKKKKTQTAVETKNNSRNSFGDMNIDVRVLLSDCVKDNLPVTKRNGLLETEGSDSESCFVSEKKPKKTPKSKNDKEDESGKNNLLNYFAKVDKVQNNDRGNRPTIITVEAIVHSPPKDKSKLIKERDPNIPEISPVLSKKSKKKKNCNFDDIKVIEENNKTNDTSLKNSDSIPTTPQPQIENVSPDNPSSKGKLWKMRVKLTPSLKLESVIAKNSTSSKCSTFFSTDNITNMMIDEN